MCIQYLQQECIDSAKNGIPPKAIPGYWLNYNDEKVSIKIDKETGEILDSDDELERKRFYQRVLTEKKPITLGTYIKMLILMILIKQ